MTHPAVLNDERAAQIRAIAAEAGCADDRAAAFYWALVAGNHVADAAGALGFEPARYTRETANGLIESHGWAALEVWDAWAALMEARTLWEGAQDAPARTPAPSTGPNRCAAPVVVHWGKAGGDEYRQCRFAATVGDVCSRHARIAGRAQGSEQARERRGPGA